jgi:hypothetical protein
LLNHGLSFEDYRIQNEDSIVAMRNVVGNRSHVSQWLKISSDDEMLNNHVHILLNKAARHEALRLRDVALKQKEGRFGCRRHICHQTSDGCASVDDGRKGDDDVKTIISDRAHEVSVTPLPILW